MNLPCLFLIPGVFSTLAMTSACYKLFDHVSAQVTAQHIIDFCPSDPGYGHYVHEYKGILKARTVPKELHFDITEPIVLNWGDVVESPPDDERFRRFRIFVNVVGFVVCCGPEGPTPRIPMNCLAVHLIEDAHALGDALLLTLLYEAFGDMFDLMKAHPWEEDGEAPFLLLGQLILALLGHAPSDAIPELAARLMVEGSAAENCGASLFMWNSSGYDTFFPRWKHLVAVAFPENSPIEDVALLRDALLD